MKTGLKATYDFSCRNHKFEIGKTYELSGTPIPCKYGFHYCKNPIDVLGYYPIKHTFRLLEIEDLGISITKYDKSVTNKLRVIREIPKEEYYQLFGIINNQLTTNYEAGYWTKQTFDENNNRIRYEDSFGDWTKYEFNENNNETYCESANGLWSKYEYDQNNKLIDAKFGQK
jgi:hypothetical protein